MDPISDFFIRLKNAQKAGHQTAAIPHSRLKYEIGRVLERRGFVEKVERKGKRVKRVLEITLRGGREAPAIQGVKLLSTPGRRLYRSYKELRPASHGGIMILTTPKGILSGDEARKGKVGGELIAEIW